MRRPNERHTRCLSAEEFASLIKVSKGKAQQDQGDVLPRRQTDTDPRRPRNRQLGTSEEYGLLTDRLPVEPSAKF